MISKLYYTYIFLVQFLTFMFLTIHQLPMLFHTYLIYIINNLELERILNSTGKLIL